MAARLSDPVRLGPVTLKNRTIRAAAFEGMAPGHEVSDELLAYHRAVAEGGVGMTTVAYAAVEQSGLAFAHQLWLRKEAVPGLRKLTDAVHAAGAKACIQLGHCGNMAKPGIAGGRALAPSAKFNLYGPVMPRAMTMDDISRVTRSFGEAVRVAKDAGFDAVEVHAGHGYLISQFLSPHTNRRTDEYGGPLERRMRFMREVMREVRQAAAGAIAVVVKTNLRDGFEGGNQLEEGVAIAKALEEEGADALVLTGGFVSRAPMFIMRGPMPMKEMSRRMTPWWMRTFVGAFGEWLVPEVKYADHYFLDDAREVRKAVKLPLVYVGGVTSLASAKTVLGEGFEAIALARALIREPGFVNRVLAEEAKDVGTPGLCDHCNVCAARIYTTSMACHHWPGVTA
ncbi:MAG: NADH:flavin oxidoreductase [Myxococcaceae bacterium]|nr:NADH:flavin oxidoreductase [Myxococcaceae bacterium]